MGFMNGDAEEKTAEEERQSADADRPIGIRVSPLFTQFHLFCPIGRRMFPERLLLLLFLICFVWANDENEKLPLCRTYQACASQLKSFPLLSETAAEIIEEIDASSGDNSGVGEDVTNNILYDEFVTAKTSFDLDADPNVVEKRLCRCSDEDAESECSFDTNESVINVDPTLGLAFCTPIANIRAKCIGRRNVLRVMGQIHETGEALTEIEDTAAFCSCPRGIYRRIRIEPWLNGYVFTYQCGV